ncbi:hypothetical protein NE237_001144 [Protea cynaroides]|uniref:Uncharacterized protein n=1 Tax=Protea cynaroides TaxID=273540 RepID=A0A9Q0KSG7_9MAGN|nr:hypothetical protein NE237_001144 [Protea cynaroides]
MYYEDVYTLPDKQLSYSVARNCINLSVDKLETQCVSIVQKIKDAYGWPGDAVVQEDVSSSAVDNEASSISSDTMNDEMKTAAKHIASYQVVLSKDGKTIGFQPTSKRAVNYWGDHPLTMELYNGQKLSPGLIEPGLKIPCPNEVAVIELLMSLNPGSQFALARPVQYLIRSD